MDVKLAHAEFAYSRSTFITGHSPFEVVYDVNLYLRVDLISLPKEELVHKDVETKLKSMMKLHQQVRDRIEAVNATYKQRSTKNKKPRLFVEGDLVWVHLRKERFPSKHKKQVDAKIQRSLPSGGTCE